jgi:hypothetical protein
MPVTVPGTGGGVDTISAGTGDVLNLAQIISNALNTIDGGSLLAVTGETVSGASTLPSPTTPGGTTTEVVLSGTGDVTVPAGYDYVVNNAVGPITISGSNAQFLSNDNGATFFVSGQSTVAATGGDNVIVVTSSPGGSYVVSAGTGDDTINVFGTGTAAGGAGSNLIFAGGDGSTVLSSGQDTVVAQGGASTIDASGAGSLIFGEFDSTPSSLAMSVSGSQTTVSSGSSDTNITTTGGNALVFGSFDTPTGSLTQIDTGTADTVVAGLSTTNITLSGSGALVFGGVSGGSTLNVLDMGTNDTVSGLSSPTTVTAGAGSTGLWAFGGSGGITFLGGEAAATVVSGSGINSIVGGTGGIVVASNGDDTVSGLSPGGATLFGAADHSVLYTGTGNLEYAAGLGNETLDAGASTGNNLLFANTISSANDQIMSGTGNDTFVAGGGADTLTGGGGENTYFFLSKYTTGQENFITDAGGSDFVSLIGYDSTQSSVQTVGSNTTLTLSDNTRITFLNLTSLSSTHITYG